jgi:hypothetical protein
MKKILTVGFIVILVSLAVVMPVMAQTECPVLKATQKCTDVQLTWTSYPNAEKYVLFRSTNNLNPPIIGSTTGLEFTDTNVLAGQYYYQVLPVVGGDYVFICGATSLPVTVTSCASTPEFPSLFLPVTLIIGLLGTVLYIQKTRER